MVPAHSSFTNTRYFGNEKRSRPPPSTPGRGREGWGLNPQARGQQTASWPANCSLAKQRSARWLSRFAFIIARVVMAVCLPKASSFCLALSFAPTAIKHLVLPWKKSRNKLSHGIYDTDVYPFYHVTLHLFVHHARQTAGESAQRIFLSNPQFTIFGIRLPSLSFFLTDPLTYFPPLGWLPFWVVHEHNQNAYPR